MHACMLFIHPRAIFYIRYLGQASTGRYIGKYAVIYELAGLEEKAEQTENHEK